MSLLCKSFLAVIFIVAAVRPITGDARPHQHSQYSKSADEWIKQFPDCGGKHQSPVNIRNPGDWETDSDSDPSSAASSPSSNPPALRVVAGGSDWENPAGTKYTVKKNGTSLQLFRSGANALFHGQNELCHLVSAHSHTPSEHQLFGRRYDLEMHFVHDCEPEDNKMGNAGGKDSAGEGREAVIALLFEAMPAGIDLSDSAAARFL